MLALLLACAPMPPVLPLDVTPQLRAHSPEAAQLLQAARNDEQVYARLVELCIHHPGRLAGTEALNGAVQRTLGWMQSDKQENVRAEPVQVPVWVRGEESLHMLSPQQRSLGLLGLGGSVGTPGIEAPVVVLSSFEELSEAVRGKIVLFDVPMATTLPSLEAYGKAVQFRVHGASRASRFGAVAVLVRSVTTRSLYTPHTGGTHYEPDIQPIPTAAIPPEEAAAIRLLLAAGQEVRLRLKMDAQSLPDGPSANVIGELRGSELPEQIVVLGAHLDSWDVGQGAHDDGAGVVQVVEALRLLRDSGLRPRRTLRVVLYTNEENGLRGGKAYAAAHHDEPHFAAVESDLGGGMPLGWSSTGSLEQQQWFVEVAQRTGLSRLRDGGGADISTLTGVLQIGLLPDDSHYFDFHHTHADTVDHVDPAALKEGLAAMLLLAWELGNADGPRPGVWTIEP